MYIMHWRDYKNRDKFQMWIPKLELSSLFLYLVGTGRICGSILISTRSLTGYNFE